MKKYLYTILLTILVCPVIFAAHIKGGFFTYKYLGPGSGNNLKYQITLTVYMICNPNSGQLSNPINFSIFNAGTNQFVRDVSVGISNQYTLSKNYDDPCISGNEIGCYYTVVVYDLASVELPANSEGYTISYQRCCRIAGINNLINSGAVGNTFAITIPGSSVGQNAPQNSSPNFLVNDTVLVCRNSYFQYSFQATDIDGDSLSYQFCSAYEGASQSAPSPTTAAFPPYTNVPYNATYSGAQPMGSGVTINPVTGLISGTAPTLLGQFVVCVCVNEYRNGTLIATTRKELHIDVRDCSPMKAQLNPRPSFCDDLEVNFQNDATGNPPGVEYLWNFGDPASGANNSSSLANPTHLFSAPGDYTVKLLVTLSGSCTDSSTTLVRVWPGFYPGFRMDGICVLNPYTFTDTTRTNHGVVDSWRWDFGDNSTLADTSRIANPQWTYSGPGVVNVSLVVSTTKGCRDTIAQQTIEILDKPLITMGFRDTLICQNDNLNLQAAGNGGFNWTPLVNIINAGTATPTVTPLNTTWYYVILNNNGCINRDSVLVRVTPAVYVNPMPDTTICRGDTIQLRINSNGLQYQWIPAVNVDDPNSMSPRAVTLDTTTYQVTGIIGGCSTTKQILVRTVPYPIAKLSNDTTICFNSAARIRGISNGTDFRWIPSLYLNNSQSLTPVAKPPATQQYVLAVFDTKGCPKPGLDTVVVTVNPEVIAFAGRDTSVVVGQPLQLDASGGTSYLWNPAIGLSSATIANPIAQYNSGTTQVRYQLIVQDNARCADTTYMTVRIFQTTPSIFVPTGFTPNGDGKNDYLQPILAGMKELLYFRVFNRWGQLVFETKQEGVGWNGQVSGKIQATDTFVWVVNAIDYSGQPYFSKGTVTLIK